MARPLRDGLHAAAHHVLVARRPSKGVARCARRSRRVADEARVPRARGLPDEVLFALLFRKDEEIAAFEAMLEELPRGTRAHLFDNVRAPNERDRAIAERHHAAVIAVSESIARAPDRARFDSRG